MVVAKRLERLRRESDPEYVNDFRALKKANAIELNYRWEQKYNLGGERAYVEISAGDTTVRTSETEVFTDPRSARSPLAREAKALKIYLRNPRIRVQGTYLKGEKQEESFGGLA